jgi:membrane-bound metal-dependent hydrolase YbcI (DUF457 family)
MVYYDHAMVGATLAVAVGAPRRHGWPVVLLAALAGMAPDWDALSKHISPRTYEAGHRVWGHNLFAVTLAGVALGLLGYLIQQSRPSRRTAAPLGTWIALCVLILWSHPILDLLYCGLGHNADWPVALLWPVLSERFAVPWVPWSDWGATALLGAGLLLVAAAGRFRQAAGCASLVLLGLYIGLRGALRQ